MQVAIRTDASSSIGTGHVMRCLTLAGILRDMQVNAVFICREFQGNMCDYIEGQGFSVLRLAHKNCYKNLNIWADNTQINDANETKALVSRLGKLDWMIVDHYSLGRVWEENTASIYNKLFVVDDLANRQHICDVLLDQNLYESMTERYQGLVPPHCELLVGPRYSMLRQEFFKARDRSGNRLIRENIRRVLVFFGGSDPTCETEKTLQAIADIEDKKIVFDIVIGSSNKQREIIESTCSAMANVNYHCQINNIADLMIQADLGIGAAGSASWERCYLGLPTIIIITADNQKEVAEKITKENAVINLGVSARVKSCDIYNALQHLIDNTKELQIMSENSLRLMPENILKAELACLVRKLDS